MKKVLAVRMGKVGYLLNRRFAVTGLDKGRPHYEMDYPFDVLNKDVSNANELRKIISEFDAVVSALPYFLNKQLAKVSFEYSVH